MANLPDPTSWQPGSAVLHRGGTVAILLQRRTPQDGWLIVGGGGISDSAAASSWVLFTAEMGQHVWQLLYLGAVSS